MTKATNFVLLMRIYWRGAMYDKIRSVDAALRFLEGTQPPIFLSFNIAVCNLCRLNEEVGGGSSVILGMMAVVGAPISVNVWSILIDGYCKSGLIEVAAYILEKMVAVGCSPNIVTCTSLIKAFLESRMPAKAFEILGTLESKVQPDLVVCNCLLSYFCKSGYPEGAVEFYDDMIDRGFLPDKYNFVGVLSALCRLGRIHEAVNVYHGITRSYPGIDAHIHTIVIKALAKSGSFHKAMGIFKKASAAKFPLDAVSYNVAIDGLIKDGRIEEAYSMFSPVF